MKTITFLATLIGITLSFVAKSQDSSSQNRIQHINHQKPVWIEMMDNPNVNYYDACKAFYTYWQGKELPAESEGEANDLGNKEEEGLDLKDPASFAMIYEYKRFKNWEKVTRNRIDSAGRILTEQELNGIWQVQTQGIDTHIE